MINTLFLRLTKTPLTRKIFHTYRRITFSNAVSIAQISPIQIEKSAYDITRINLLIPSINEEHFFGGTATAIKIFNELLEKSGDDIHGRIILTDAKPTKKVLEKFSAYHYTPMSVDGRHKKQIIFLNSGGSTKLRVAANDKFVSTAWWTAYAALKIIKQQVSLFGPKGQKLLYLIQDFEPGFYNWSSHYALAESTYQSQIPTIAVFNSSFLKNYFKTKPYSFLKEYVFEPHLNPALKKWLPQIRQARKKQIIFYGRPTVDRNCFPLIIEALRKWVHLEKNNNQWQIISIGEKHPTISIVKDYTVESLGKLNLSAYANLLTQSAIGISFMVSPHPSYPPLEMAHFGLMTLTNSYAMKDLSTYHQNIISLRRLTPDTVSDALSNMTKGLAKNPFLGTDAKSLMPSFVHGSNQFPFVEELLEHLFDEPTDTP